LTFCKQDPCPHSRPHVYAYLDPFMPSAHAAILFLLPLLLSFSLSLSPLYPVSLAKLSSTPLGLLHFRVARRQRITSHFEVGFARWKKNTNLVVKLTCLLTRTKLYIHPQPACGVCKLVFMPGMGNLMSLGYPQSCHMFRCSRKLCYLTRRCTQN
jgi:hypothetical protein